MSDTNPRDQLLEWGRHVGDSPLYEHLVGVTARSDDLLSVLGAIEHRPPPNVYFAAIQYLLLEGGGDDELASFYPSLTDSPRAKEEIDEVFERFVRERSEEILSLARSRYTQTNECRRCVALLPGIAASTFDGFHLVEIGTSAGLNLAMDHYEYDYEGQPFGPKSPVKLFCSVRGDRPRLQPFEILSRTGIDLNVVDRSDPDDRRWLVALVWPEHHERRRRLTDALELTSGIEMDLIEGSAPDVLPGILAALPDGDPVVVMNSFVLNQMHPDDRARIASIVDAGRENNPIHRVSLELLDRTREGAVLEVGADAAMVELGSAHPHGAWLDLDYQVRP